MSETHALASWSLLLDNLASLNCVLSEQQRRDIADRHWRDLLLCRISRYFGNIAEIALYQRMLTKWRMFNNVADRNLQHMNRLGTANSLGQSGQAYSSSKPASEADVIAWPIVCQA
ncbi:hypothetical protein DPMN_112734 [Dreissena polymorpha]|uniref:Uncharacterized protein n=1 Tax=Dreissena polymorpha TaxID=45954 RepID=A0A9D4QQA5_DREPO|nr:hypothetical protein DPMN_112734 [Dreissena polymorpha]